MKESPEKHRSSESEPGSSSWFPMRRVEALALAFLILFSVLSFLPPWREIRVAGMVLFGWLMAALMLLSPALMLMVFRRTAKDEREESKRDSG